MICHRCEGSGKAYGADRPFEWSPERGYPGPCPVCNGFGVVHCCEGDQATHDNVRADATFSQGNAKGK